MGYTYEIMSFMLVLTSRISNRGQEIFSNVHETVSFFRMQFARNKENSNCFHTGNDFWYVFSRNIKMCMEGLRRKGLAA